MVFIVPIGVAGSGKSTAAALLVKLAKERGLTAETVSFAAPLKAFCSKVFRFPDDDLYGPSERRSRPLRIFSKGSPTHDLAWGVAFQNFLKHKDAFLAEVGQPEDKTLFDWFCSLAKLDELTPRVALQTLGTEWGRALDPEMWVNLAANRSKCDVSVAEDGRFLNEAQVGVPVLISRPSQEAVEATHASEQGPSSPEMREYCLRNGFLVLNDDTVEVLAERLGSVLDAIMQHLLPGQPRFWIGWPES